MADTQTRILCTQIVSSHFGPLTYKVADTLLTRGRLTFPSLVRYTQLKPRTVRACILVLIQHGCVWHAGGDEDTLEFNPDECLSRGMFGYYVHQAKVLFGDAASEIVQLILDHGKLRPPEIISQLAFDAKKTSVYSQALHTLVSQHYLKPSTILSHISPQDKRIQYEADEKAKLAGLPTAKQYREAKEAAYARLKREEEDAEKVGLIKKSPRRHSQIEKATSSSEKQQDTVVDETVYFRVNYTRFNVHLRSTLITRAASERFNPGAALVLRAAFDLTLPTQMNLTDPRSDPISIANIIQHLHSADDEETLTSNLATSSGKTPSTATCIKEYLGMLAAADNPTPAGRASSFLSFTGSGGSNSKLQIDFETTSHRLRIRLLEHIVSSKHSSGGLRILRLLLTTPTPQGKMDEKQISKAVMMASKDVRPLLSAMTADGFIQTVEVAKSADRNPTRMFYLWYADPEKSLSPVLAGLYKTLSNILIRLDAERTDPMLAAVLEKRERSDVREDMEGLLSGLEKDTIRSWEEKEERMGVLAARIWECVFVVREMGNCVKGSE